MRQLARAVVAAAMVAGIAVGGVRAWPGPQPPKPDLKVRVLLEKQLVKGQWYVRIAARVFNVGPGPAAPSTLGLYCVANGGGPCPALDGAYDLAAPIEAGATAVVRMPTPVIGPQANVVVPGPRTKPWPNGDYVIKASADLMNVIVEVIEVNNRGQAAVHIP